MATNYGKTYCGHEAGPIIREVGWILCTLPLDHEQTEHESIIYVPCMTCGGFDLHFDDCPDKDNITLDTVTARFDDAGNVWVVRDDG